MNELHVRRFLLRAAGLGLIAAVVGIYLGLIGIVERFEVRNVVTGFLTLGLLAPVLVVLVFAYRAAIPPRTWGAAQPILPVAAAASVVTGLLAGMGITGFLLLNRAVDVRFVFVNATPNMERVLAQGVELPAGALLLVPAGAGLGLLAAGLFALRPQLRRPLLQAVLAVLLLSLMEPFMRPVLLQLGQNQIAAFFYQSGGLTATGAALIFAFTLAAGLGLSFRGEQVRERFGTLPATQQRSVKIGALVLGLAFLLWLPQLAGVFLSGVLGTVGLFIVMGLGLNIVVGYAGLLDLGYVAFFAIGAYAMAILTSPVSALGVTWSFWLAIPVVMLIAAFSGLLIGAPVLRLRGDYLAIVTLGIGEIVRILLLSDALRPWTGGAQGILRIPPAPLFGVEFFQPQNFYYPVLIFAVAGAFVAWSLANSRIGRAWNAMREDEDVAAATGINVVNYKLLAFALGAVFGCIAGAFLSVKLGSVFPHRLDILVSITVLSVIILGGMGSIPGVIVGAFALVGLPELLREFAEYRLLIYGGVLISMMLLRPEGLIPSAQRRRELHEAESDEEQWQHQVGAQSGAPVVEQP